MSSTIPSGVITGKQVQEVFALAKEKKFALPAVNVIGNNTVNTVLETAAELNSPVIIQFSNGGAIFNAGKSLDNTDQKAAIAGAVAGAKHIHELADAYGATVILNTDHCAKKLLPWIDGLLDAGEKFYAETGKSLYSSHMIDLSEEPLEENIAICKTYLERMSKSNDQILKLAELIAKEQEKRKAAEIAAKEEENITDIESLEEKNEENIEYLKEK